LDNSWIAEGYTTADVYLTMRGESSGDAMIKGWNLTLLVNNAFDESYLGGIAGQGAWIGAPRTVSASFTLDL
jgi:outer membrane receptor protein involved in Fe transport